MVTINQERIEQFAELLKVLPNKGIGLNFYSFHTNGEEIIAKDMYPCLNHPSLIDFFYFVCLHQYGFWHGNEEGYVEPLIGNFRQKPTKGSDLIWKASMNALNLDPEIFSIKHLSQIDSIQKLAKIFRDDDGPITFPDWDTRLELTANYANWFLQQGFTPKELVLEANQQPESLKAFRDLQKNVAGYDQDPLEKKNLLLAMALANRPEKCLLIKDPQNWSPIVDYHLMRVSLRLGLAEFSSSEQFEANKNRRWVDANTQEQIRQTVWDIVSLLIELSGRPMSFIDEQMWRARKYCPEMTNPNCEECIFKTICAKRIELFQPVFRTTDY